MEFKIILCDSDDKVVAEIKDLLEFIPDYMLFQDEIYMFHKKNPNNNLIYRWAGTSMHYL